MEVSGGTAITVPFSLKSLSYSCIQKFPNRELVRDMARSVFGFPSTLLLLEIDRGSPWELFKGKARKAF